MTIEMRWSRLALLLVVGWPWRALAYRPFDQTDADVAEPEEVEVELGPIQFLHEPGHSELVPGFVLNVGVADRLEAVLDGQAGIGLGSVPANERRWAFEPALLLKAVLREGALQDKLGPSIALEAGILLPSVPAFTGTGASLALIASQRWSAALMHVNVMAERSRDGAFDLLAGTIVEGPMTWIVRPVVEAWIARAEHGITSSLLGGAIWRVRTGLSLDGAVRVASMPERLAFEVRLGLTWAVSR